MNKREFANRIVVLDTETTGLNPQEGHRIIEIGCVELVKRRLTGKRFHVYINPDRIIDEGAIAVHGITNQFLDDKPQFEQIVEDFIAFIRGAELVIHNAPFDVGFINHEFSRLKKMAGTVAGFIARYLIHWHTPEKNIRDKETVWTHFVNAMVSIIATGSCMAHYWMRKFWRMSFC